MPLKTSTCGPPPGPAPVTMSAKPSPLTSPAATNTPPVKFDAISEEAVQEREVGAAEDLDVRSAAGARAGDDVVDAVAVDVAGGDLHARR